VAQLDCSSPPPPYPTSASALPGENRTNEIVHFYPRQFCIKVMHINRILSTFLILWLAVHPVL